MKKDLSVQIIAGTIAIILGIYTVIYGIRFLADESQGNVRTCLMLLLCCAASITVCSIITIKNTKKYKK